MARFSILRSEDAEPRQTGPTLDVVDLSAADLRDVRRDPAILCVARVMPTRLITPEPLDDIRPDEAVAGWGLAAIGATTSALTGAGVRVAILDTGLDAAHPAFRGIHLIQNDFAGSGSDDANGHGTHVAGTILGRDVDSTRIGVARGVTEALVGKVLRDDGIGSTDMLFEGLLWAARQHARVISFALSFDFPAFTHSLVRDEGFPELLATSVALRAYRANLTLFETLIAHFAAAFDGGPVLVCAGGNESRRTVSPNFEVAVLAPAVARGVLSVAALSESENGLEVAAFSNTAPSLAAPGGGIVSAAPGGGLRALNGSSMAAAHTAGIAALWWEAQADAGGPLTGRAIANLMCRSTRRTGFAPGTDATDWGRGLVQAPQAALNAPRPSSPLDRRPPPAAHPA